MKTPWRHLEDVFRLHVFVFMFRKHLQDVFKTSWSRRIYSPYSYVFRRRLQEVLQKSLQDIFKKSLRRLQTSLRHLPKMLSRRFQDISSSENVLVNKSLRRSQHVSKTCPKDVYLQKDLPRSHFWEMYGQCTKFTRVMKISQVLVFHFTTLFSGFLQRRI